ncbi:MAG: 23S rRNA (adenine(2503)-C(2))-methyltransferase RlmN, partial [Limisphaerales bacterium]
MKSLIDIKNLNREEITERLSAWGEKNYRIEQLLSWLYEQNVSNWDAMSNLPKKLRDRLANEFTLHSHGLVTKQGSRDTTQKFL